MRYLRVVVSTLMFAEDGSTEQFISLVVDTDPSTPIAIARCSDGAKAQAIVDALNGA